MSKNISTQALRAAKLWAVATVYKDDGHLTHPQIRTDGQRFPASSDMSSMLYAYQIDSG